MRIMHLSSDVCSSDLLPLHDKDRLIPILFGFLFLAGLSGGAALVLPGAMLADIADAYEHRFGGRIEGFVYGASAFTRKAALGFGEIGRAYCRTRVCQSG